MSDSADDRHGPVRLPAPPPFCGIDPIHAWLYRPLRPITEDDVRQAEAALAAYYRGQGYDANGSPVEDDVTPALPSAPCPSPSSPEPNSTP